jgi:DNA-directed RNA polymerase subunit K/omega
MVTDHKDNKYRKVLLMVQRAKQIHNGANPRVNMPGRRATVIARAEVDQSLISFDYIKSDKKKRQ